MPVLENPKSFSSFNILCLNGQQPANFFLVDKLLEKYPKLIRDTDLLVGSGLGGMQALLLASNINFSVHPELYDKLDYRQLKETAETIFGEQILQNLSKRVLIFAPEKQKFSSEKVKEAVQIFRNFGGVENPGTLETSLVDLVMSSSLMEDNFNPSMAAIAEVLDPKGLKVELNKINLLAIGTKSKLVDLQCRRLLQAGYYWLSSPLSRVNQQQDVVESIPEIDFNTAQKWLQEYWR